MNVRFLRLFPVAIGLSFGSIFGQTFTDVSELLMPTSVRCGPGASAVDFNNDGLIDIYTPGLLYLNTAENGFQDILSTTGIFEGDVVFGAAFGDYDNDSYLDILFEDLESNSRFYRNNRNRTFTHSNTEAGLLVNPPAQGAAWADFNLDGELDLFVNNDDGENQLFKNTGNGTFEDISFSAGVHELGNSYGMSWGDYNGDGYPDVFIATCSTIPERSIKHLFRNNGNETFTNINVVAGVNDSLASWGVVWLDFDNDRDLDIYVSNTDHPPRRGFNRLYRNNGNGTFTNIAESAGVAGEASENSYGVSAADFDNDGWVDIYVANQDRRHRLYRNSGDGTFVDIAENAGVNETGCIAVAVADFNADGWIDIFAPGRFEDSLLFNDGGDNHWLSVQTRGVNANYYGVGARIELVADGMRQIREIRAGDGFCSQNFNLSAHFGLGETSTVDSLIVHWPGGARDTLTDILADQVLTIVQGQGANSSPSTFELLSPADGAELNTPSAPVEFGWEAATDPADALTYRLLLTGPQLDTVITVGNQTSFSLAPDFFTNNLVCSWTADVSDGVSVRASTDVFHFADVGCPEVTDIEETLETTPEQFSLGQNFPNPFNPETTIIYSLTQATEVNIQISNTLGQTVRTLIDSRQDVGSHRVTWDGKNDAGQQLPSGVYYYRIQTERFSQTRSMLLMR